MKGGFTLVEVIISIGVSAMLLSIGLLMTMDNFHFYLSRSERDVVVDELESARARAMSNIYNTPWGVCYDGNTYTVFRGVAYSASASTNEVIAASTNAVITSVASQFSCSNNGVVFSQLAGTTTATTITIVQNNVTQTIATTYEGTIRW